MLAKPSFSGIGTPWSPKTKLLALKNLVTCDCYGGWTKSTKNSPPNWWLVSWWWNLMVNRSRKTSTPQKNQIQENEALKKVPFSTTTVYFLPLASPGQNDPNKSIGSQDSLSSQVVSHAKWQDSYPMTGSFNPILKKYVQVKVGTFSLQEFILVNGDPNIVLKPPPRTSQNMILIWPNFEHLLNLRPALIQEKKMAVCHLATFQQRTFGVHPPTKNTILKQAVDSPEPP